MTEISLPIGNNVYKEDIAVTAAGTEILGAPATIWDMTVSMEDSAVAVVNFSNSITSYDNTTRCGKVVISGPNTLHFVFPKGRHVTTGLCATANNGSVDVRVSYD
jgi:hypothetical protein